MLDPRSALLSRTRNSRKRTENPRSNHQPARRSTYGGRHELGQNYLVHRPTIDKFVDLVARTEGAILEIGAGAGALTSPLAALDRPLTAVELDEHRVRELRRMLPDIHVVHGDVLQVPLRADVVVGSVPFHVTTPVLRRLLRSSEWREAVLLTQWEVARKRAGVGGSTMMTAQSAPWFTFRLESRVPSRAFDPMPSVDGGLLVVSRREEPLVDLRDRIRYESFVHRMFTGRGNSLPRIVAGASGLREREGRAALDRAGVGPSRFPRDLRPGHWAALWGEIGRGI